MNILAKGAHGTVRFGQSGNNSHYHIKPGACLAVYGVGNSFGEIYIEPVGDEGMVSIKVVQAKGREFPISHQIEMAPTCVEAGRAAESFAGDQPAYLQPDPWPPDKSGICVGDPAPEPKVGEPLPSEWPAQP